MKLFLTLVLLIQVSFSQIISSVDAFRMESSYNFRLIHYPLDLPDDVSQTPFNGISYFNGIFAMDESQVGATVGFMNYNFSSDFGDANEWLMSNIHVFYKSFQDDDTFLELGFFISTIEYDSFEDIITGSMGLLANSTNAPLVSAETSTVNAMYGQKFDVSNTGIFSHVSGIEFSIPSSANRDNIFTFRSNLGFKMKDDQFDFGVDYKIYMYLAGIEGYEPDFSDRFINTLIPNFTYHINESMDVNLGFHVYTSEGLEDAENRIELGFSFFTD